MSTIKSSAENLTLNADGSGNDIILQSNGSTKAIVTAEGNVGIGNTNPVDAKLTIDNVAAGDSGLKITHGIGNSWGLFINSDVTTHSAIYADADSLTTGEIAYFYSNSADTSSRKMIRINNGNAAATGTTALHVTQASTGLAADFTGTGGIRSAGGIKFGTDTAAANALDDYEEGTWTPAIGVGSGISMGTIHSANYTKIGNTCTLSASVEIASSNVPASGDVRITGFPFSFKTFGEGGYPVQLHYTYRQTTNVYMSPGGYMYYQNTTVGGNNAESVGSALDALNYLAITFTYLTT